jgi:cytolysin (calcineurin-like family phosphatase)
VLLGTDGHGLPETQWFAAAVLRDAWGQAARTLTDAGAGPAWVEETRRAIFEANAREVYSLT